MSWGGRGGGEGWVGWGGLGGVGLVGVFFKGANDGIKTIMSFVHVKKHVVGVPGRGGLCMLTSTWYLSALG